MKRKMESITLRKDYGEITIQSSIDGNNNILLGRLSIVREHPEFSIAPLLAMIGQFLPMLLEFEND